MRTFRFDTTLRVTLADGALSIMTPTITVEAPDEVMALSYLPTLATELCQDMGSFWFDGQPVKVEVTNHFLHPAD